MAIVSERRGKTKLFDVNDYSLSTYDPIKLYVPSISVANNEIESRVKKIARNYGTYEALAPRPVVYGDIIFISTKTEEAGKPVQGLSREGITLSLGKGTMPYEFERALIGMNMKFLNTLKMVSNLITHMRK